MNPIIALLRRARLQHCWFMSIRSMVMSVTTEKLITLMDILENIDKFSLTFP